MTAAADLFDQAAEPPDDVVRGLALVGSSPPLWPVGAVRWAMVLNAVGGFASRWDGQARAAGWSTLQLYGLHQAAPYANLAAMGGAWLMARSGHLRVLAIDAEAIHISTLSGSRLRLFLPRHAEVASVAAWSLCRGPGNRGSSITRQCVCVVRGLEQPANVR